MRVAPSEVELEAIEALANYEVEPGTRCPTCHRRKNKSQTRTTPEARKIEAGYLPNERAGLAEEALDTLQEYVGADPTSYARGELVEKLVQLGIQQREELRSYFTGDERG